LIQAAQPSTVPLVAAPPTGGRLLVRVERQTASRHGLDHMERKTMEVTPTMAVEALLETVQ